MPRVTETNMLPPGRYFVGDPCYVFGSEDWNELLIRNNFFEDVSFTNFNGGYVVGLGTAFGDGCYHSDSGFMYSVDAGLIGVVSENLVNKDELAQSDKLGKFIEFDKPFKLTYENGTIIIGDKERVYTGDNTDDGDGCDYPPDYGFDSIDEY